MSYSSSGSLTTDKREVAVDETWETQTDWEAYQSKTNIDITTGTVTLAELNIDQADMHSWYDAQALGLSDGQSVTNWTDETGNGYDLQAGDAPTYFDDGINSNPTVSFAGADDFLDVAWSAISQPNHIFIVFQFRSYDGGGLNYIVDSDDPNNRHLFNNRQGTFNMNAGSNLTGKNVDTNPHLASLLFNGSNSVHRMDGTDQNTGDAGSESMAGMTLAEYLNGGNNGDVWIGEVIVYNTDKTNSLSNIESYLADKWNITL